MITTVVYYIILYSDWFRHRSSIFIFTEITEYIQAGQ